MSAHLLYNPRVSPVLDIAAPGREPQAFHRRMPGYAPTPLIEAPELAQMLGVGHVWIKDESSRLGMPAFKLLGASWAIYRTLAERLGAEVEPWQTVDELAERCAVLRPLTLATATDGNHGRAVARMARLLGFTAHIFVPKGTAEARIIAIASEGARVTVVEGSYDDAVERAAAEASERCLVISDTAWPGYESVPRRVIEGYSTIFYEVDDQLKERDQAGPDLIAVQIGVGALAAAVIAHYRHREALVQPKIVGVEPIGAACVLASIQAGRIVSVPGPHTSIMAGLNCGTPSPIAWPLMEAGIDLFVAVEDERALQAMRQLAALGIVAGETGGAGLAGLLEVLTGREADAARAALGVDSTTRVLILVTEGATDPVAYERIVGQSPERVKQSSRHT